MSDEIDRAQQRDAEDRDRAIEATRQRIAASFTARDRSIDGRCIDCDEPIEPARLQVLAGKTSRCASCARDHEHRMKGYRR
ncbi:TraR/DksA C4-type zinc finger protein [Dyella lutea]|uniref:TraR/DksA C4-type zinc finger protein n=1 Tax=Dyella lutea TaxID=2950441 RepID=A0ABT1FDC0_9GAMM|nr:TraR/DksA C4-type zinc finger protein [Dyella lutea]MCP1375376.1 TraR/DksA C4-type zinc finger protein [Dyella lutea]